MEDQFRGGLHGLWVLGWVESSPHNLQDLHKREHLPLLNLIKSFCSRAPKFDEWIY